MITTIDHTAKSIHQHLAAKQNVFLLLKLPIDLIVSIMLLLNKHQLLTLELCNRMCYRMINNRSFLKKCKIFKKFHLTQPLLIETVSKRLDLYKYCTAEELSFKLVYINTGNMKTELEWFYQTREKFELMMHYGFKSYEYDSNWLELMFKSIKRINLTNNGMVLLDLMPIELLFDKHNSNLKKITFDSSWFTETIYDAFGKKYLSYFDGDNYNDRKPILLQTVTCCTCYIGDHDTNYNNYVKVLQFLDINHLELNSCHKVAMRQRLLQHVKILSPDYSTIDKYCIDNNTSNIRNSTNNDDSNKSDMSQLSHGMIGISTLRLIRIHGSGICASNLLSNKNIVHLLNLQNNLKNLTLHFTMPKNQLLKFVLKAITKDELFALENLNILFEDWCNFSLQVFEEFLNKFFDILIDKIDLLSYQFKQLNIGIRSPHLNTTFVHSITECEWMVELFSWNTKIDTKFIYNKKHEWTRLRNRQYDSIMDKKRNDVYLSWQQSLLPPV